LPIAVNYDGRSPAQGHGFQAHVGPMLPTSRGHIRLKSADPREHPRILFNYLATEDDRRCMRDGIRLTREIISQHAFDSYRGRELAPGDELQTDAELDQYARTRGESAYHPSCTCKMGADDSTVVDARTRVHEVEGLRVIDASIMPRITNGNLNAPTIMIAERAADIIRERQMLAPLAAPVYRAPDAEHRQR
jgi:choline dehydrogenase